MMDHFDETPAPGEKQRRRGIYILPSLFTTASLFAGFYAIVQAMNGNFEYAPLAIFIAAILDALDGRIARLTHTESDFGAEYDSLVDMVSFGLAPALIMYEWALSGMGKLGWLAAFIYTAGAGLRLARFNTQVGVADKRFFRGLPSPSAAALVVGLVWVLHANGVPGREISIAALIMTVMAGMLMVSNIRYRSFKDVNLRGRVSFMTILSLPLVLVLLFQDPPQVLFLTFLVYALSGPLGFLFRRAHREAKDHPEKHPHGRV
ncbi:MAG: CDP-diacylglycerol--serine O-phosphatidyltransferase [Candidatus Muproteobacteria bacterium RIFCSPHIGHO2_12_FULL_60_33]|uniref:CDP-diacylglycerol--serine O-phosphatidyltransferase n=1 Tax=Candidatus Muproteobacteria bacterium RIFCSPLOWO2_01_FULL_60_18 TaxID=1817768 RepID=A0A1F6TZN6_9PROT|nr:MAG: CDP-diacylglycerol--serine O-phosphatidyltransferase [Candidatus Muproteobacteria bacterium RIFCSPHIGHO2_01_60_12]OGI50573.1 MAG: CDP-diacylglycerol--serine O-phosphatidyltransferase [Candidatus Muproteobacteria bacterium RIFCSPLOWO2_01_FULL_60_18]OGI55204.1 MAG: CDP-diacylglycerol--serine O-phosphatidyltransferase [Candidatus Muproteobacteria bacterium RIFCSPHIGHO2_02_FULL_60_13]OGI56659.1 MAG: CDP-diacylglycerol--serine O-phosphatidyltransferase [Candidatus Muproteobacteria bacterium R